MDITINSFYLSRYNFHDTGCIIDAMELLRFIFNIFYYKLNYIDTIQLLTNFKEYR